MTASTSLESAGPANYVGGYIISGKYVLEEELGRGGMGAVWRAHNTALDTAVAIKLVRADLNHELLSERLMQEARAAAMLSHPGIVRVFDVGRTEHGDPYLVMELLQGRSFSKLLEEETRLSSVRALQILLPIADALAAAHAKGIVHRDVKPDNVFLVESEGQLQPKLLDFGIVKMEQRHHDTQLTMVGSVLGSPDYMSPEQARGVDSVDSRTDIWSFSVMLYESLTGKAPFAANNYNAQLRRIVEENVPTLQELAAGDAELSAIVSKGMMKDPRQRWTSMAQLGLELARWLLDRGITEDCCGVSLESKWLNRSSLPPRATRSSFPDAFPDPLSGVRSISRNFATPELASEARGSGSESSGALAVTLKHRSKVWWWALAFAAAATAGLVAWLGLATSNVAEQVNSTPEPEPERASAAAPQRTDDTDTQSVTSAAQPALPVEALPIEKPRSATPSARARAVRPAPATNQGSSQPPSPAAAPEPPPVPPENDLMSPY
jgi:serine/threonine-protein kinase